ncbi:hypothetical protein Ade02nite_04780 [Paractinoplanes deccanensis]|uniref:Uncharacterized protein n=1 Tax=Paractinoplanes deccanensis TaxID=113561 RepID=A0ABQ3XVS1_9ACTN|nr:hypothetical protein Ade02nite_04780 [Actinoplanes deccanensis]
MTGRRLGREQVFRRLMAAWELPEPTGVLRSRDGVEAVYLDHGLRRHLVFGRQAAGSSALGQASSRTTAVRVSPARTAARSRR